MYTSIRKRDGKVVPFSVEKISHALEKAGTATGEYSPEIAQQLAHQVLDLALRTIRRQIPTVEEMQDVVETVLLQSPYRATAKAYIIYREKHAEMRAIVEKQHVDLMEQYLGNLNWEVNENSNMAYSLQGLNNFISAEVSKTYWLEKVYPSEIRDAQEQGDFHIHDLQILSTYCVGWDLQDLLHVGFRGAKDKLESKPAKHFKTALGQLVNFFYTMQGESAGAQAVASFDTLLAPFIRRDGLTYDDVKQALQEFLFNMNVPTRVGFQTPFTNITLDLVPPPTLRDQAVIIGGEPQETTYGEYQVEMDILNRALTEVYAAGDARGRVFSFPIPTYNITKDFDWDNPNLDNLWRMTAKYGIPYFSNFINSELNPEDARSMCCRLRLDNRELRSRGGGLFGANPLTGSIGVVTINLPRLGYLSRNQADFLSRLDRLMDLAKESLEIKRKFLERLTAAGLYPYSKYYLRVIYERTKNYWTNHFSTIGLVGMNEAVLNLLGRDIATSEGKVFATRVLEHMRSRMQEFQEETGNMFNLEATPAEGTAFRFAKTDKERYPDIMVANEDDVRAFSEAPFYTNSTHLPVDYSEDMFEVLDHQDLLQTKYTGGTVVHLFVGEEISDINAVKSLVKKVCSTYHLPYFTLTPTFSVCPSHGYVAGKVMECTTCGEEMNVYSRIVGYMRPVQQWNQGKKAEFRHRKTYQIVATEPALIAP